jgi:hypothetical protein
MVLPEMVSIELAFSPLALFLIFKGVTDEVPAGTFTSISVPPAFAFAVTFTGPKNTSLGPDGLKLVPVMVTGVPTGPEIGKIFVIVGACAVAELRQTKEMNKKHAMDKDFFILIYIV